MSDETENDLTDELAELLQTTGIISQVLEPCRQQANQTANIQNLRRTHPNVLQ